MTFEQKVWNRAIEKAMQDMELTSFFEVPSHLYARLWEKIHKNFDKFKNEQ